MRFLISKAVRPAAAATRPLRQTSRFTSTISGQPSQSNKPEPSSSNANPPTSTITRNAPPSGTTLRQAPGSPNAATPPRSYLVNLTPSNLFPVYAKTKAAGQSRFTVIKRVEGDKRAFIDALTEATGVSRDHVKLNPVTGHVEIKGSHVESVKQWLTDTFGAPPRPGVPVGAAA